MCKLPARLRLSCVAFQSPIKKSSCFVQVRKAKTDKDMAIDLNHMKHLIDSNTVAIVGAGLSSGEAQYEAAVTSLFGFRIQD